MSKLNIFTEPSLVLHKKCAKVKKFDEKLSKLVLDMTETMRIGNGAGLAAPQIGKLIKIICVEYDPDKTDEKYKKELRAYDKIPLTILVNPKITKLSKETYIGPEGCLSLPKVELDIKRSCEINVIAQDITGKKIRVRARDFFARLLQHEIDHLDGILITDRSHENKK